MGGGKGTDSYEMLTQTETTVKNYAYSCGNMKQGENARIQREENNEMA